MTQLRLISMDCKFYDQDEMMRYILVLNSTNKKVQERLMEVDDLDIGKAIKIAKAYKTNLEQLKLISSRGPSDYAMEERTKDCSESRRRCVQQVWSEPHDPQDLPCPMEDLQPPW